jgi:pyruvate dehydrogenase E1 component alpha subunit
VGCGDGNDVVEVYKMTSEVLAEIRAGGGPRFLEFSTYRWREHCGPSYDNDLGYRTEAEFLEWKAKEPIGRFESWLRSRGVISATDAGEMAVAIESEVNAAFAFAEASPFPEAASAYADLYGESPASGGIPERVGA